VPTEVLSFWASFYLFKMGTKVMAVKYLEKEIVGVKVTPTPRYGMTAYGYTIRSGAPTSKMVLLAGENRWRRVMVWQFSNAGTAFVRVKGEELVLRSCFLPDCPWIIRDRTGKRKFPDCSFTDFGSAWEFLRSRFPVSHLQEFEVEEEAGK
jgi:hypothetical protein